MRRDSVAAPIVCQQEAFSSPLVRLLGTRYVPGNILVGADGTIVGRDLDAQALEQEVGRL